MNQLLIFLSVLFLASNGMAGELTLRTLALSPDVLSSINLIPVESGTPEIEKSRKLCLDMLRNSYQSRKIDGTLPASLDAVNWDRDVKYLQENKGNNLRVVAYIGTPGASDSPAPTPMSLVKIRGGAYKYGEARYMPGKLTLDEAKAKARQDLITKIRVSVSSEQTSVMRSAGTQGSRDFYAQSKSVSQVQLEGIEYFEGDEAGGKVMMAFVSLVALQKSMQNYRAQASELYRAALQWQKDGLAGAALKNCWAIQRLASVSPEELKMDYEGLEVSAAVQAHEMAQRLISDITISSGSLDPDDSGLDRFLWNLRVTYRGRPVQGGMVVFLKGDADDARSVQDGIGIIPLGGSGSDLQRKIEVGLLPENALTEGVVSPGAFEYGLTRTVVADYSQVIKVAMRIEDLGSSLFRFVAEVENQQLQSVKWEFGDAAQDFGNSVLHQYKGDPGDLAIRMTLNKKSCYARSLKSSKGAEVPCDQYKKPAEIKPKVADSQAPPIVPPVEASPGKSLAMGSGAALALGSATESIELFADLEKMKNAGKIRFTKQKVDAPDAWYRIFITPEGKVAGFFAPGDETSRKNPDTGELFSQWKMVWKGKQVASIWVQEL
jgi:hypothetical protein